MVQLARGLNLRSPFQIILYVNSSAAILPPTRTISQETTSADSELCYRVQTVQVPTAEQYQSLVTALYEKDVVELCYLLGQGLDLMWSFPDSGHISTLVALAIFRDNDNGAYDIVLPEGYPCPMCTVVLATKDLRFSQPGVSLTYLLLH